MRLISSIKRLRAFDLSIEIVLLRGPVALVLYNFRKLYYFNVLLDGWDVAVNFNT